MGNNNPKKVLVITYYWPPSGGSGVQRWVKFVKYLHKMDWQPIIYTPSNPEQPATDESLLKDIPEDAIILKNRIFEPYSFYKRFVGLKKDEKLGSAMMSTGNEQAFLQKLSVWIRGNFFIPDARRFWIRPSVKFLSSYLKENHVDAIVSTGPPHTLHMIGMKVAKKMDIPWLADFRDPWTNIDFFEDLKLTFLSRWRHHQLEQKVLDSADRLVVVSNTMKKEFSEITSTPISVIPNGYDDEDFTDIPYQPNEECLVTHTGMLTPSRNPNILWQAIKELADESDHFRTHFRLQLIGKVDSTIKKQIKENELKTMIRFRDYVPHEEIIPIQQKSEALLLIINNTPNAALLLTGKLFEYIAAKRPVICISPVYGDATDVLKSIPSSKIVLYNQKEQLKKVLFQIFGDWKNGVDTYQDSDTEHFSREKLTLKLIKELNTLTA